MDCVWATVVEELHTLVFDLFAPVRHRLAPAPLFGGRLDGLTVASRDRDEFRTSRNSRWRSACSARECAFPEGIAEHRDPDRLAQPWPSRRSSAGRAPSLLAALRSDSAPGEIVGRVGCPSRAVTCRPRRRHRNSSPLQRDVTARSLLDPQGAARHRNLVQAAGEVRAAGERRQDPAAARLKCCGPRRSREGRRDEVGNWYGTQSTARISDAAAWVAGSSGKPAHARRTSDRCGLDEPRHRRERVPLAQVAIIEIGRAESWRPFSPQAATRHRGRRRSGEVELHVPLQPLELRAAATNPSSKVRRIETSFATAFQCPGGVSERGPSAQYSASARA